jgi:hypothetical protein
MQSRIVTPYYHYALLSIFVNTHSIIKEKFQQLKIYALLTHKQLGTMPKRLVLLYLGEPVPARFILEVCDCVLISVIMCSYCACYLPSRLHALHEACEALPLQTVSESNIEYASAYYCRAQYCVHFGHKLVLSSVPLLSTHSYSNILSVLTIAALSLLSHYCELTALLR